jgi:hypothetical protein
MTLLRPLGLMALVAASVLLAACEPREWKTPNMTALTPRLQPLFEKTKSVCFGRFMVDVPESATVSWGLSYVPLGITIYLDGYDQVQEEEQKFVDELKNTKAIYLKEIPLFLSEETTSQPPGKIVTGYEGYDAINGLKINGYFKLGKGGFIVDTRPLRDDEKGTVAEIKSIAQRLRLRAADEAPAEPGNCIEYAFLPDEPGGYQEVPLEHVRIGFRLKEFPDTHLSIYVAPSNPHFSEGNSLEWRLEQLEKRQKAEDPNHPLLKTRYFRRGPRQIRDWQNGWEGLSRSPDQPDAHGFHDFALQVRGVPSDLLRPYADIRMQTGVGGNAAGAVKPSLTDEEAVAVWDKITSSIRVRPTSPAPVKASSAGPSPNLPLGTLAATGSVCPQTGWWQSTEAGEVKGGRRQRLKAGEQMPHAVLLGEPSLWQKFKGERPTHRTATVWKLVDYGDAPAADGVAQGNSAEAMPPMQKG